MAGFLFISLLCICGFHPTSSLCFPLWFFPPFLHRSPCRSITRSSPTIWNNSSHQLRFTNTNNVKRQGMWKAKLNKKNAVVCSETEPCFRACLNFSLGNRFWIKNELDQFAFLQVTGLFDHWKYFQLWYFKYVCQFYKQFYIFLNQSDNEL